MNIFLGPKPACGKLAFKYIDHIRDARCRVSPVCATVTSVSIRSSSSVTELQEVAKLRAEAYYEVKSIICLNPPPRPPARQCSQSFPCELTIQKIISCRTIQVDLNSHLLSNSRNRSSAGYQTGRQRLAVAQAPHETPPSSQ